MLKKCIISNGKIINVGDWDYCKIGVQIFPPEYDSENNIIKEAIFGEEITNPLPEGAIEEIRNLEYALDRGWHEVGTTQLPTLEEQVQAQAEAIKILMEALI
jgi:hypothetical protein